MITRDVGADQSRLAVLQVTLTFTMSSTGMPSVMQMTSSLRRPRPRGSRRRQMAAAHRSRSHWRRSALRACSTVSKIGMPRSRYHPCPAPRRRPSACRTPAGAGVELARGAGDALGEDAGVFVYQDAHRINVLFADRLDREARRVGHVVGGDHLDARLGENLLAL